MELAMEAIIKRSDEFRIKSRFDEIKESIKNNNYEIDSKRIADKMIQFELLIKNIKK